MKRSLPLVFLVFSYSIKAQFSKSIDSSIVEDVSSLDSNLKVKFVKIYNNLFSEKLYHRIDSIHYSSVIIEAHYLDTTFSINEYYYINEKDKFPAILYVNGEYHTIYNGFNDYDKAKLKTSISTIKKSQSLNYQKKQIIYFGCIKTPNKLIKKRRKERLLRTFQIQVFIDSKKGIIKTSLQHPPKRVNFKIEPRSSGF